MFLRNLLRAIPSKIRTILLTGGCISSYLKYDLNYHPKNNDEPLKKKKIYFIPDLINQIKKFNTEELAERELVIKHGLLYNAKSMKPLNNDELIYIMNKEKKMYVTNPKRGVVNHTSLGDKQDVICAGEIKIKEGRISSLDENSGHYRPKNRIKLVENNLKESGAEFHSSYIGASIFSPSAKNKKFINDCLNVLPHCLSYKK